MPGYARLLKGLKAVIMRLAVMGALAFAQAACGSPQQADNSPAEPARSVMETEAEKVCAEMTRFSAETLAGKPAETQALLRREFDLCVKSVASDDTASAEGPALRGRTTAP